MFNFAEFAHPDYSQSKRKNFTPGRVRTIQFDSDKPAPVPVQEEKNPENPPQTGLKTKNVDRPKLVVEKIKKEEPQEVQETAPTNQLTVETPNQKQIPPNYQQYYPYPYPYPYPAQYAYPYNYQYPTNTQYPPNYQYQYPYMYPGMEQYYAQQQQPVDIQMEQQSQTPKKIKRKVKVSRKREIPENIDTNMPEAPFGNDLEAKQPEIEFEEYEYYEEEEVLETPQYEYPQYNTKQPLLVQKPLHPVVANQPYVMVEHPNIVFDQSGLSIERPITNKSLKLEWLPPGVNLKEKEPVEAILQKSGISIVKKDKLPYKELIINLREKTPEELEAEKRQKEEEERIKREKEEEEKRKKEEEERIKREKEEEEKRQKEEEERKAQEELMMQNQIPEESLSIPEELSVPEINHEEFEQQNNEENYHAPSFGQIPTPILKSNVESETTDVTLESDFMQNISAEEKVYREMQKLKQLNEEEEEEDEDDDIPKIPLFNNPAFMTPIIQQPSDVTLANPEGQYSMSNFPLSSSQEQLSLNNTARTSQEKFVFSPSPSTEFSKVPSFTGFQGSNSTEKFNLGSASSSNADLSKFSQPSSTPNFAFNSPSRQESFGGFGQSSYSFGSQAIDASAMPRANFAFSAVNLGGEVVKAPVFGGFGQSYSGMSSQIVTPTTATPMAMNSDEDDDDDAEHEKSWDSLSKIKDSAPEFSSDVFGGLNQMNSELSAAHDKESDAPKPSPVIDNDLDDILGIV